MPEHGKFDFKSSADLLKKAKELGLELPFSESIEPLFRETFVGSNHVSNRFAVHPMEGFDAESDGSPGKLAYRRYKRYAEGGSGLIWFEATSVVPEGRSNPRQLLMNQANLDAFKALVKETRKAACQKFGEKHRVFLVLQLTHSGRFSKPAGRPEPRVSYINPFLDKKKKNLYVLSDEELDKLQEKYIAAAALAEEAGFDAVDIKACHGYLLGELLSAFTREKSYYGGPLENRVRFLEEVVQKIHVNNPDFCVAVRLNAFDGIPYPYGFGFSEDPEKIYDLSETRALIQRLIKSGCSLLNITAGVPAFNPHFGRPYDLPLPGASVPDEHPLEGIGRLLEVTGQLQKLFPEVPFVGTGYTWLRRFFPHVAAASVKRGDVTFVGLGRSSFAYPDAPQDLKTKAKLDPARVCVTCSRCTELMRNGHSTGCVVRDTELYGRQYKKMKSEKQ
jgi:2,4-dienoyl-CoA reductase-like NADH-dependent reductase (Old Yellow Enzyme family)